jgi:hypothetical protein
MFFTSILRMKIKIRFLKDFFSNQITVHQKTEHRTLFLSLNSLENYMIQSMTGFGKATLQLPTKKITIEVKS